MRKNYVEMAGVALLALTLSGCLHHSRRPSHLGASSTASSDELRALGSAVMKVSAAAESAVRYKDPPPNLSEEGLLAFATQHDPSLLQPFREYKLRIKGEEGHAIVLVCTKNGAIALLEDAGCSGPMDKTMWETDPPRPCDFSLRVRNVCQ
jgi:hypothetical protein